MLKIIGFRYVSSSFNKAHVHEYMQVLSLGEYEWMRLNPFFSTYLDFDL